MNTEALSTLLDKMDDATFVQQFVSDPTQALEATGLGVTVTHLTDVLSREPAKYERFLQALSAKVDLKAMTSASAASCVRPVSP
jgi:hypothetical protein